MFNPAIAPAFCTAILSPDGKSIVVAYDASVPDAVGYVIVGVCVTMPGPKYQILQFAGDLSGIKVVKPTVAGTYHFNVYAMGPLGYGGHFAPGAPPVVFAGA